MKFICKFCESTEYEVLDGWRYCKECHNQNDQVLEFDAFGLGTEGVLKKTKILDTSARSLKNVADKTELTTWEGFNYILHGLVGQLVDMGVTPAIKETVFLIYAHYLKTTEVAFFNKEKPTLPKLPPIFSKKDADILYNHQRRARKRRRSQSTDRNSSISGVSTNRARRLKIAKLVDQSQRSEYQFEMNDTKTDINRTLNSLADISASEIQAMSGGSTFGSASNASSLPLEFSTYARSAFKKKVPKKHISKHCGDFTGDLRCHTIKPNDLGPDKYKLLSRKTLFAILYCALNYHKEDIEIGDLIRFCREGHLAYNCAKKFIPKNLSEQEIQQLHDKYTKSKLTEVNVHNGWRDFIQRMSVFLDIELEHPDMFKLCQRYVDDLNLPEEIYTFAERMLVICPPQNPSPNTMPSYEARAMAFILFILKLLFGVDDSTEKEMSESAKVLNKHLERNDQKRKLFVWSEWMEFLEARKSIIEHCHAPSFIHAERPSTEQYLRHVHIKTSQNDDEEGSSDGHKEPEKHTKATQRKEGMTQFAKYIAEVDKERDTKDFYESVIIFPPSLTPNMTYLEIIREKYSNKVQISPLLLVNHAKRDVMSLLDPNNLYKDMLRTRTRLLLEEANTNSELKFVRWTYNDQKQLFTVFDKVSFNITDEEYKKNLQESLAKHEKSCEKDAQEVHTRRINKFIQRKSTKGTKITPVVDPPENFLFDLEACQDNTVPEPSKEDYDSTLPLKIPHFYYWSHLFYTNFGLHNGDKLMYEEISENFPSSFTWLINHCAKMIEMAPNQLYRQLLILENQFLFKMKNMNKVRDCIKFRSKKQLPKKMCNVVKQLNKYW